MTTLYYHHTEYEDWRILSVGKPAEREHDEVGSTASLAVLQTKYDLVRISAPPRQPSMPGWYLTEDPAYGVRWRMEPARRLRWDREGVHAVLGGVMGYWLADGIFAGGAFLVLAIAVVAVWVVLFAIYEVTEGQRIFDWAYRDVGAALALFLLSGGGYHLWQRFA